MMEVGIPHGSFPPKEFFLYDEVGYEMGLEIEKFVETESRTYAEENLQYDIRGNIRVVDYFCLITFFLHFYRQSRKLLFSRY